MYKTLKLVNKLRKIIKRFIFTKIVKAIAKKVGKDLIVNGYTLVTPTTILGDNVSFNGMKMFGGGQIVIGNNFHSGVDCMIISQNHNFDSGETIPYDKTYIYKDVVIEDNVWIGSKVNILGGVTIGEGAIIQAGSTVVNDIPACAIAGGHPARVFKYRNKEHYYKLKSENKVLR
ncbi:acyltransferase [Sporomusa malonica]|uniref:Transferase hexapeptide (Six repeat-containing protein) n=2 Tax=Sporomusa malonica TaxID=112901 RepID=A0A1W1YSY7_9FIRM|nr:transferase hexapeptide (six repeat-containing protein) [Sporomusa malonica]